MFVLDSIHIYIILKNLFRHKMLIDPNVESIKNKYDVIILKSSNISSIKADSIATISNV